MSIAALAKRHKAITTATVRVAWAGEDGQHGLEAYVQTKTIYLNA